MIITLQRLTVVAIILGFISILFPLILSYFGYVVIPGGGLLNFVTGSFENQVKVISKYLYGDNQISINHSDNTKKEQIFTADELAMFKGENEKPVYVAFLGKIYDVSSGRMHYGPNGGYNFFAGKDATRAFITGDFTENGLRDDLLDLEDHKYFIGIKHWMEFYEKDYIYVGKVNGRYYDRNGLAKQELKKVWEAILEAEIWVKRNNDEKNIFPPCNSEWKSEFGGRVWCTKLSGGINRNWSGVPRKYHKPGTGNTRCVCVRNTGPPTGWNAESGLKHNNKGDLDNPNLRAYPGCSLLSDSCPLPDD